MTNAEYRSKRIESIESICHLSQNHHVVQFARLTMTHGERDYFCASNQPMEGPCCMHGRFLESRVLRLKTALSTISFEVAQVLAALDPSDADGVFGRAIKARVK